MHSAGDIMAPDRNDGIACRHGDGIFPSSRHPPAPMRERAMIFDEDPSADRAYHGAIISSGVGRGRHA